ncbi:MAG: serine/threonine-protein kinase [Deltaproteobacteria bacterium]|nr:serine/threonine-protein kinase [Myxococcales bacterium]MDP3213647.1 serine/threonine-protein kinase [Deltaproteobacteria bacterium]
MYAPGEVIADRYEIVRALDSGAMGEVFEAVHRALHRRVALKVLRPELGVSDETMGRFSREAQAAAAIGHPNIVDVIDLGIHEDRPFLVMELLEGESLLQRMTGPCPPGVEAAVRIAAQVLSALASAHALGVIHRDVKPENVFVLAGSELRVKLLDFGVSKFAPVHHSRRAYTREGVVLGTPRYIAPEQWLDARRVDHRADLFSVGVLLYEMLTGTFPYPGDNESDIFRSLVEQAVEPVAPSVLRPEVPRGLDAVVLRALEGMPAARFPSAQDFLDALQPFGAVGIEATDAPPSSRTIPPPAPLSLLIAERPASSRPPPHERPLALRSAAWMVVGALVGVGFAAVALPRRHPQPAATASVAPIATPPPPSAPPTAHIRVADLLPGAVVRVGGVAQPGAGFELPRGTVPVTVEVSRGSSVRQLTLVPDRDQTLVFGPPAPAAAEAPPQPEPARSRRRAHRRSRR